MFHILFLVECIEVPGEGLCHHGIDNWLGRSRSLVQLEGLVGLLVRRLKFEFLRLIVRYSVVYILSIGYITLAATQWSQRQAIQETQPIIDVS